MYYYYLPNIIYVLGAEGIGTEDIEVVVVEASGLVRQDNVVPKIQEN